MIMSDVYCVKQVNLTLTKVSYSQTLTTAPPTAAMTSVEALHIIPTKLQLLKYGKLKKNTLSYFTKQYILSSIPEYLFKQTPVWWGTMGFLKSFEYTALRGPAPHFGNHWLRS